MARPRATPARAAGREAASEPKATNRPLSRDDVAQIVRAWQRRLGLDHWRITIDWDRPAQPDADASTWRANDYDKAELYFESGWRTWSRARANELVVHELLHLVLRDVEQAAQLVIETRTPREVDDVIERAFMHALEGAIDRLALRIVAAAGVT